MCEVKKLSQELCSSAASPPTSPDAYAGSHLRWLAAQHEFQTPHTPFTRGRVVAAAAVSDASLLDTRAPRAAQTAHARQHSNRQRSQLERTATRTGRLLWGHGVVPRADGVAAADGARPYSRFSERWGVECLNPRGRADIDTCRMYALPRVGVPMYMYDLVTRRTEDARIARLQRPKACHAVDPRGAAPRTFTHATAIGTPRGVPRYYT